MWPIFRKSGVCGALVGAGAWVLGGNTTELAAEGNGNWETGEYPDVAQREKWPRSRRVGDKLEEESASGVLVDFPVLPRRSGKERSIKYILWCSPAEHQWRRDSRFGEFQCAVGVRGTDTKTRRTRARAIIIMSRWARAAATAWFLFSSFILIPAQCARISSRSYEATGTHDSSGLRRLNSERAHALGAHAHARADIDHPTPAGSRPSSLDSFRGIRLTRHGQSPSEAVAKRRRRSPEPNCTKVQDPWSERRKLKSQRNVHTYILVGLVRKPARLVLVLVHYIRIAEFPENAPRRACAGKLCCTSGMGRAPNWAEPAEECFEPAPAQYEQR
ncbi:hypothetical protein FB451DRAFT_1185355 [Mycena latifolia]|nr:hypothetical protein FB451DRAFT_1185355 [Mycena latifolia]